MSENTENKIDATEALAGIITGVKQHTRDGETVIDFSGREKIEALREMEKRKTRSNPFASIWKAIVSPLSSMQE